MPQITIKAFSDKTLPSPLQFQIWIQEWSKATPNGVWGQPLTNDNRATISVKNLSVEQVAGVIQPAIDVYNQTHVGNDTITVVVD